MMVLGSIYHIMLAVEKHLPKQVAVWVKEGRKWASLRIVNVMATVIEDPLLKLKEYVSYYKRA